MPPVFLGIEFLNLSEKRDPAHVLLTHLHNADIKWWVPRRRASGTYRTREQEATMQAVMVYRVDYARKTKDPIGIVLEMRKTERVSNYHDLLRLARRTYALDMADALHIVIDVSQARRAYRPTDQGRLAG
jgi:hypothetical protein